MAGTIQADIRKLEKYILALPAAKQQNTLDKKEREVMIGLVETAAGVRGDLVRLSTADDTAEQARLLQASIASLTKLQEHILTASQYDLLGPADVAHLSALADYIKERLG